MTHIPNTKTTYVVQYSDSIKEPYYWEDCDSGVHQNKESAIHSAETYWKPVFPRSRFRVVWRVETDVFERVVS